VLKSRVEGYLQKVAEKKLEEEMYDTKKRSYAGTAGWLVLGFTAAAGFYHLYTAYVGPPQAVIFRNLHWMMMASVIFLIYPARKNALRHRPEIWDIIPLLLTLMVGLFLWWDFGQMVRRIGAPLDIDIIFGAILVLLVLEAVRRTVGYAIAVIAVLFIVYAYFGPYMPGILAHGGYSEVRIFPYLYYTDAGIFNIPLGVSARFIVLFIIFGAFLERSGASYFFRDLSLALAGRSAGGPAKAAVLFSAFIGSITGSTTANVGITGSFTIPMMKKLGYKREFAAGVEANASCGGQILPPVMGAVAFVMAEFLGVPYRVVVVAAIIPALIYFSTSYFMIHYEALKKGLVPLPEDQIPNLFETIKKGFYYFTPLILLIYMIMQGRSPSRSVFFATLLVLALSWFKKETRMYPKDIINALSQGVLKSLEVAAACAAAGIIIGMTTMTGLGLKFSTVIDSIAGGNLWAALPLTMLASFLLGMGIPTIAKYIILATLVAPALVALGAPLFAAHFFILFFGVDADVTPPVGLASFAAASIAQANPMRTGIEAFKIGITAYVMPYLFIYSTAFFLDAPLRELIEVIPTCFIGAAFIAAGVRGYFLRVTPMWQRLFIIIGSVMLMMPEVWTDIVGAALVALIALIQYRANKMEQQKTTVVSG